MAMTTIEGDALERYGDDRGTEPIGRVETFLHSVRSRGFAPRHILDVGANVGAWTRSAASVYPEAEITMVEPQEHLVAPLTQLCQELPHVNLRPVAAGSRFEQRDLAVRAEDPSSTFCDVGDYGEPVRLQRTSIVPLDSFLDDPGFVPPELVKIDVEGFEMEVFGGAERTLAGAEMLIIETSFFQWYPMTPRFSEIVSYLAPRGFEVYDFCWFLRRPLDAALGITDTCFVRSDSPLRATHRWTAP